MTSVIGGGEVITSSALQPTDISPGISGLRKVSKYKKTKINKVDLDDSEKDLKTGELAESKSDCHGNPFIPSPTNHHH